MVEALACCHGFMEPGQDTVKPVGLGKMRIEHKAFALLT